MASGFAQNNNSMMDDESDDDSNKDDNRELYEGESDFSDLNEELFRT